MKKVIKNILKKLGLFDKVKYLVKDRKKLTKKYIFESRKKNYKKVCFILAGYKEFAYDIVFGRIKKFCPNDVEVCILSSGKYSKELSEIAKKNGWSYLSTKVNNVSLVQNVANNLFDKAEYIYKLDEDIFITENFFDMLYKTHIDCEKKGEYKVGFVAPTIPINGFGHMIILKKYNLINKYEELFEKPIFAAGADRMIENNPDVAKFMWGEGGYLPNIDQISKDLSKDKFEYVACPIRFSIGAIIYKRDLWKKMGMFAIHKGSGMGQDEVDICSLAMKDSNAIIVSKNTAVGHLSFGKQNQPMREFFETNKKVFNPHK
jgi:hypothetical protein